MVSMDLGVWLGAIMTIGIYSYIFKENLFYRFAEHSFVGVSAAYFAIVAINTILNTAIIPLSKGNVNMVIPIILGLMLYGRFSERLFWLSRFAIAFLVGTSTAFVMRGQLSTNIIGLISGSIISIKGQTPFVAASNILLLVFVITSMIYFFFTAKIANVRGMHSLSTLGRYVLMATFGASFGQIVQTRVALLTERIAFLLFQWMGLAQP